MLMDYIHTNPDAVIRYHASDIILKIVSGTAFLVLNQAWIRAAAIFHLGHKENNKEQPCIFLLPKNQNLVASASEAETGGI